MREIDAQVGYWMEHSRHHVTNLHFSLGGCPAKRWLSTIQGLMQTALQCHAYALNLLSNGQFKIVEGRVLATNAWCGMQCPVGGGACLADHLPFCP